MDYGTALQRASLLLDQHRPAEAEQILRDALQRSPDASILYFLLAQCRVLQKDPEQALPLLDAALMREPEDASYHCVRGHVLMDLGRQDEARDALDEALRLEPAHPEAWRARARLHLERTEWTEAEAAALQALAFEADNEVARSFLATALRMQGKQDATREQLAGMLSDNPESDLAHCNLGWSLLQEGKPAEAEKHFLEALRIDPEYPDAKTGLLEAFKARSPSYRLLLRINFLSARFGNRGQWWLAGALLLILFTRGQWGRQFPLLSALFYAGMMVFIVATNLTEALGHLIILLDRRARSALSWLEQREAALLGTLGVLAIGTIVLAYVLNLRTLLMGGWCLFGLTLPLAHVFTNESREGRRLFLALAGGVVAGGLIVVYRAWLPPAIVRVGLYVWVGCLLGALLLADNPRWRR